MAPTIQTGTVADRDRKQKPGDKKPDLVCRVKYCNTLPDIPFDPKFIKYPFLPNRFVEYKPTSLERSYKHDLLTEHDLGVTIDLINPDTYALEPSVKPVLGPEDERLLEEDTLTPQDSKRSRHHNKIVPWLKKTEYISNEFNRYGHSSEKTETKVGYNVKKLFKEENMYMERESQISAINKTFADVKLPIEKHYSKPGVTPVEVLPVFPDFQLWRFPFAQVMFDTDPAPPTQMEEMSQAMIRGVVDESGEQFVAYFLPTEETSKKRKREPEENADSDEEEFEYRMAREYNWNVKNKASKGYEENYFVAFRDKEVYYNELETRVRLSKRRAKPGMPPNNSVLVVKHRPYNEMEFNHQKARMSQLEPPIPEEEEEEEKAEEEEEKDEEEGEKSQDEEKDENEASEAESDAEKDNEEREETKSDNDVESDAEEKADSDAEEKADSDAEEKADSDAEEKADSDAEEKADSDAEEKAESEAEEKAESEAEEKAESENERSSAKSSSESEKGSSSESEAEEEEEDRQKKKRDEEEIFGSDSD